jgi:hypothetical protein
MLISEGRISGLYVIGLSDKQRLTGPVGLSGNLFEIQTV